jgi:peroxiredoxin
MKKLLVLLALIVAGGVEVCSAQIPSVRIENEAGKMINTADLTAKKIPVIVSFWSTSCKPCILELDTMNDLLDEWLEEAEFEVVAVCVDDSKSVSYAKTKVASRGWDRFTILYDKNQEFKRALNVTQEPHTFIFDGSGKKIYSHIQYTPGTEEEYIKAINAIKSK